MEKQDFLQNLISDFLNDIPNENKIEEWEFDVEQYIDSNEGDFSQEDREKLFDHFATKQIEMKLGALEKLKENYEKVEVDDKQFYGGFCCLLSSYLFKQHERVFLRDLIEDYMLTQTFSYRCDGSKKRNTCDYRLMNNGFGWNPLDKQIRLDWINEKIKGLNE